MSDEEHKEGHAEHYGPGEHYPGGSELGEYNSPEVTAQFVAGGTVAYQQNGIPGLLKYIADSIHIDGQPPTPPGSPG